MESIVPLREERDKRVRPMHHRIYLIGYMAAGKTTIGRQLAERLQYRFFDLDSLIETAAGKPIAAIFDLPGGTRFREIEKKVLYETFQLTNAVIACGGGTPCFFDNMNEINKQGISVWVCPPLPVIIERLTTQKDTRPLLSGISNHELPAVIQKQYEERVVVYRKANLRYNEAEVTIDELTDWINAY
jgi:shikimate kinase